MVTRSKYCLTFLPNFVIFSIFFLFYPNLSSTVPLFVSAQSTATLSVKVITQDIKGLDSNNEDTSPNRYYAGKYD